MTDWHPASEPPPEGLPVIAEYHPFNQPDTPVREHVVWWMDGAYRPCYNTSGDLSYCTRWRHLPAIAERDAEIARLYTLAKANNDYAKLLAADKAGILTWLRSQSDVRLQKADVSKDPYQIGRMNGYAHAADVIERGDYQVVLEPKP